jgi:hypothetical protein
MPEPGDVIRGNGVEYTFRTAEQIRELIGERDRFYAAGQVEEGNVAKTKLKYTALLTPAMMEKKSP